MSSNDTPKDNVTEDQLLKDELLYLACCDGDVGTARSLLFTENGDLIPSLMDNHWYNCLFASAIRGHDDIISLLVQHGVDVNMTDLAGWNALHYAYAGKQPSTIELLHSLGVQSIKDSDGYLPHEYADL